jgi:hypothetical protein
MYISCMEDELVRFPIVSPKVDQVSEYYVKRSGDIM